MNNFKYRLNGIAEGIFGIKNAIHSNIYMIIGSYGIFAIVFICYSIHWLFHADMAPIYEHHLLPAWENNSDINHILGTDDQGRDIFNFLLLAFKSSIILTLATTAFVVILGAIINYILFFISPLRSLISMLFRVMISFPPMLSAIIVALLWDNDIWATLMIIGLAYLPRFVHNVDQQIMQEWQKTYISAHRLDGIPTVKIVNIYIFPNILPAYLTEIANLFSHIILALTVLTFLGFGCNGLGTPDLGIMMNNMLPIIDYNFWGFFATGMVIVFTILMIQFFNLGITLILTKKTEN